MRTRVGGRGERESGKVEYAFSLSLRVARNFAAPRPFSHRPRTMATVAAAAASALAAAARATSLASPVVSSTATHLLLSLRDAWTSSSSTSARMPPAAPPRLSIGFAGIPSHLPSGAAAAAAAPRQSRDEDGLAEEDGSSPSSKSGGLLEALTTGLWFAVPKRKKSYTRKRHRQMNRLFARHTLEVGVKNK
jgi:hypothetical protein